VGLPGADDLESEIVGGVGGVGAGDVFPPVGDTVAVEVAVARDEREIPAVGAGRDAAGVELALFPGVGNAVAVGVDAEGEIEAHAFARIAHGVGRRHLDWVVDDVVEDDAEGKGRAGGVG
jgi:hypothetical protein